MKRRNFTLLFYKIGHSWQVVAVTVQPYAARGGTLRRSLVLAFLLYQIVALEDVVLEEGQMAVVF